MSDTKTKLPSARHNAITELGALLTTVSAVLFILLFVWDLFRIHSNPYVGIISFLLLPTFFVLGLILIPVGISLEHRRRASGRPIRSYSWLRVDLNDDRHRTIAAVVAGLTIINIIILGLAAYRGLEYMDSVSFCGQVCHTVMEPEYTAYLDGPHARVKCVECHIGPGAPWFVKSKIDGIRQVWAVAVNSYERPIPSPVHDLRPARDTCEHCHWPEKFTGDLVRRFVSYSDDEANSESVTELQIRVGGGGWRHGGPNGIHWHTSPNLKVEYIASDDRREDIPWVRLTAPDGTVTEFAKEGVTRESLAGREMRTMDCVDCHNRPSHRFAPSPERAVDVALSNGLLPRELPFLRREAVAGLSEEYPDRATAEATLDRRLREFYASQAVGAPAALVDRAVRGVQTIYSHNVFPAMDLTWGTHPNHIGHTDTPGCFRCHDDEHRSPEGRTISQDCELCHK